MNSILQLSLAGLLVVSSPLNSFLETGQTAAVGIIEPVAKAQNDKPLLAPDIDQLIAQRARTNGVNLALANDIAYCESNHRQFTSSGEVLRGKENPSDVGVYQINEQYHLEHSRKLGYDIYTTEGNIDYAMWLLKNEGGRHWYWSAKCWR